MGLRAALVDRAFVLRDEEADPPAEVEGTVLFDQPDPDAPTGRELRCRLTIGETAERTRDGMTATDPRPRLICAARYTDGTRVELRSSDRIKVVSRELGTALWEVDEDPEPLRKRRRVIGWEVVVHRTKEA